MSHSAGNLLRAQRPWPMARRRTRSLQQPRDVTCREHQSARAEGSREVGPLPRWSPYKSHEDQDRAMGLSFLNPTHLSSQPSPTARAKGPSLFGSCSHP